jgi:uroporphyrinogen-III synthase
MRVLVTRPEPDAGVQAQELRGAGHEPVVQPLLKFETLEFDPGALEEADGLIVTSRNALRAVAAKAVPKGVLHRPVFCVGSETERQLREAGFANIAAVADTAEELASKIAALAPKGARLVHATGEHQAFDLAQALASGGISTATLPVYTMKPRDALDVQVVADIERETIGGAILMSPRTAEIFVSLCEKHGILDRARFLDYFCLAKSVANKLKALDPVRVHIALKPDRAALAALLTQVSTPGQDRV